MLIFLTGMPGSGKTSFGQKLAEQLTLPVWDMDDLIEQKAQMSIPAIFETHGEDHFRKLEQQVLHEVIQNRDTSAIVATGGGAPCFFDNMERINKAGVSIYIDTPIYVIVERMLRKAQDRPLYQQATPESLREKLTQTFWQRKKFYWQAQIILKTEEI
ncbi:hypothetical protein BKI52_34080 [marine bacterium AO1-C]|nr:hypothetical protein BKI52_34080 [marine bacterium AO1-C]